MGPIQPIEHTSYWGRWMKRVRRTCGTKAKERREEALQYARG
jgi:hypothetical protein